ncbi:MAG: redoxin domain-containing protein [Faecalicoccus sp.]|nr:redoxin domain-containing protein [Faecalicoccus sp.]
MKKLMSFLLAAFMLLSMSCTAFAAEKTAGLEPGQEFPDFTVTTTDGETVTLSEVLKEKDLVVLNIFASWCKPCENEFPEMETVYQKNKDNMEIISLSKEPEDTMEIIAEYKSSHGLTFPMGLIDSQFDAVDASSVPVSIFIDRNGNVGFIKVGAFVDGSGFEEKVDHFLAADYDGKPIQSEKAVSFLKPILLYLLLTTVLTVIGRWILFSKAGIPGWQSLIPVWNTCKEYSLCWNTWLGVLETVLLFGPTILGWVPFLPTWTTFVPSVFMMILRCMESIKLSKAFGKGTGLGVFSTFFYGLGRIILGIAGKYEGEKA